MEISTKTIVFFLAFLTTGLSAGLFYAWQISVIPGTKRITDQSYLETMQHINRAIINPWFMAVFMGSLVFLGWSCYYLFKSNHHAAFIWTVVATVLYTIGTFGVTVAGNVPLNNWLDTINLQDLNDLKMVEIRSRYQPKWNRYHLTRTVFSVASFSSLLIAFLIQNKK